MTETRVEQRRPADAGRTTGAPGAASSGPRGRLVLAVGGAGLVLGALVGGLLGTLQHPRWTATSLLQVAPDPTPSPAGTAASSPSDAQLSAFLQTQLIYLGSPGFTGGVQREVGGPPVSLSATQVQGAPVVQVVAQAPSGQRAAQTVRVATRRYTDDRVRRLTAGLDAQARVTRQQLDQVRAVLDQLPPAPRTGDQNSATALQRQGEQAQFTSLLAQDSAIAAARESGTTVVTVLQEVETTAPAGLPPVVVDALAGAALGALLAVSAVVVARRLSSRIGGLADAERYGVPVLSPEVPHARPGEDLLQGPVQRVAAVQAPHLEAGRSGAPELVVVGPTTGVGASYLALHHAVYAARRGTTLLVRVADTEDADVRELLALHPDDAVADVPAERVGLPQLHDWVRATSVPDLVVVTFGRDAAQGTLLVERALAAGLVDAVRSAGWGLVVDAPALDRSTAGLLAARACDACAVVVAAGTTERADLEQALDAFAAWRVVPAGIVVNRPARRPRAAPDLVRHGERRARVSAVTTR